ncbi:type II secretion system protein [Comamonas endophytica]|uniref:type II secretion system protein n=1 Tax=Comamonas endophytica TaxID=2949090 RepID=UPI00361BBBF7
MAARTSHASCRFAPGFTLIELLVVMAVLGILAAAILPLGETLVKAGKERELRRSLWEIRAAIDDYKRQAERGVIAAGSTDSGYPASLQVLVAGVADARAAGAGRQLYFLRRIPRDPFSDPSLPAPQTWRLRSYASPRQTGSRSRRFRCAFLVGRPGA